MYRFYIDSLSAYPHVSAGSHAFIISTMQILQRKFADACFYFTSGYPDIEKDYIGRTPYNINIIKRPESALKTLPIVRRIVDDVDAIICSWGDTFISFAPHMIIRKTLPLKKACTPLVLFPSSIGPFGTGIKRWIAKKALGRFDALTVRDTVTYNFFKGLGFENTKLYPDTAFVLEPCAEERINQILQQENIDCQYGDYVCINTSVLLYNRMKDAGRDYIQTMVNVIDFIRRLTKKPIILIPHQIYSAHYLKIRPVPKDKLESVGGDDRITTRLIYESLKNKDGIYHVQGDYYADEYKGIISGSEVFLGGRMHTVIAATSTCVPSVIMQYSHKALGLMRFLDMQDYVWRIEDNTEMLFGKVEQLWENRNSLQTKLKRDIPGIIADAYSVAHIVETLLRK